MTNAIRYTEKGSVRVRLVQRLAVLTIEVSDTGPGVPPKQLPLMFKEFTQLDGSRAAVPKVTSGALAANVQRLKPEVSAAPTQRGIWKAF